MAYTLKPLDPADPGTDLLEVLIARTGSQDLTAEWLDGLMLETIAYVLSGPAKCKSNEWSTWDDFPVLIQGVLLGNLTRHATQSSTNVVMETIGDYSVRYSDPALFEGRIPRFLTDGEELSIARLAGCGGILKSVKMRGNTPIDLSAPEDGVWDDMNRVLPGGA